jgi:GNAT superfamily N-acetyltransferase
MSRVWRAEPSEAGLVSALLSEFGDWFGNGGPPADAIRPSVERIMAGGDGEYLLGAPGDGKPEGVCQLRFRWSVWKSAEDAWLEDLYVREAARRSGLGRALVEAACERARERGARRIELDVQEENAPALGLYEACGFLLQPKSPGRTLFVARMLD